MHILYDHRTAGDRVEGVHIMGMVRAWRKLGHTVEISGPPGCHPERKRVEGGSSDGRLRSGLKALARKAPPVAFEMGELVYNAYSAFDICRRARRRTPDLIYERATANSVAPTLLARRWHVPIVQEVNVTADLGRFRPLVLAELTRWLERWVASRATLIVTVSERFGKELVGLGFPRDRICVCQNAIDPEEFDPRGVRPVEPPSRREQYGVTVGYVGSFLPYHRLDLLVECADHLNVQGTRMMWLLLGDGVERSSIQGLSDRRGLRDQFWMPGRVEHADVPRYIKAMDIAVLPGCASFNSPVKLFEYMAMAKPVVAPRTPAVEEIIEHGENGLLFEPTEVSSFTQMIRRLVADADLRRRIGQAARRSVLRDHTWEQNAEKVLAHVEAMRGEEEIGVSC